MFRLPSWVIWDLNSQMGDSPLFQHCHIHLKRKFIELFYKSFK